MESMCHHHPTMSSRHSTLDGRYRGTLDSRHSHQSHLSHGHSHPTHSLTRSIGGPPNGGSHLHGGIPPHPYHDSHHTTTTTTTTHIHHHVTTNKGKDKKDKDGKEEGPKKKQPLSQAAAALKGVEFIAQHIKKADKDTEVRSKLVVLVINDLVANGVCDGKVSLRVE